jgi:phosphoglycerol transferase
MPTAAACAVSIILCLFLMTWLLRLDRADLGVPFSDAGDVLLNSALVKALVDNGWVWRNPYLGAPYVTQLFDFPFYDNLNLALMKLIALFTSNYAVVLNLFFLLTFPLTALSSLVALRNFKVSYPSSLVVSLLFAFLPYHFQRGESHLFLSAYFLVPPMTMVILWIWTGSLPTQRLRPDGFSLNRVQMWLAPIICVLVGSANSYYTFFGCYLLGVATTASAIRFKCAARLGWGLGLAAVTGAVLVINTAPNWLYAMRHGSNPVVAERAPVEAEIYGLKMTHLLLPISSHRLEFLRKTRQRYDRATTDGEGQTATLGVIGDVGFVFLLGWMVCAPQGWVDGEILNGLAVLTLAALVLGTVGGLGSIFNFLIDPQIRAYNRISIYIAFFTLFSVAILLDALKRWLGRANRAVYLWYGLLAALLCVGILDQTSLSFAKDYAGLTARYQREQEFISRIETSSPRGAMIFELPNVSFPEAKPVGVMRGYDELRGYLHSRALRWSAGAIRGRPEALWTGRNGLNIGTEQIGAPTVGNPGVVVQIPLQAVYALAFAGFSGIYIDRQGFGDHGESLVSRLHSLLHQAPLENQDRRLVFFDLSPFARALRAKYTAEQWEAQRHRVLDLR